LRLRGQTTPFRPNTAPPIPHHEICQSDRPSGAFKSDRLLGAFMAHEMKTKLLRMNVVVGVAKFERISKSDADLQPLIAVCRANCAPQQQATVNTENSLADVEIAA